MAKQRTGYVFEEVAWYVTLSFVDKNGKRQTIKRRATGEVKAEELSKRLAKELKARFGSTLKVTQKVLSESSGWAARMTYTDEGGNRRNVKRLFETKTDAKEELKRLLNKLDDQGEQALDGDKMTFRELAEIYEKRKLVPAEYHGDRKIRGLRSYQTPLGYLKKLTTHFGNRKIKNITHNDVEGFKQTRLKTPIIIGKEEKEQKIKERTIAAVNRELEVFRAVLRFAVRQGWLLRSPFDMGTPLISKADEVRRERVLSHDEEEKLLAKCIDRRAHLRPLIIAALDTAARRGELFKLTWSDIDFDSRLIYVRATTTKTTRGRTIGMTERLFNELWALYEKSTKKPEALVFGITDTVKTGFASACSDAGIEGFRFHDCRHTAITRMVQSGMASHLIMKVSGHTQPITFTRYVNVDDQTAKQAASALDKFNESARAATATELVN